MGAHRAERTELVMAELLAALCEHPGEWFTTEEAAALTTTRCGGWVHDPERRKAVRRPPRHADCWQCHGARVRPRMGWEVRRYLMHLLNDGMLLIDPRSSVSGMHRWSADLEAVALEEHWQWLDEAAG